MKYINNIQKDQITGLIAKIGISIFSNTFNAELSESERNSCYEVVELIKNIIVKINEKDISIVYYNIINNMISEFRKNTDKTDSFDIPMDIWVVIYDILDISQIDKRISMSVPKLSEQDLERIFKASKEEFLTVFREYCADSENPVKLEKLEKKYEENIDSISEERFAKIVDRLYEMVHKPLTSVYNFETPSKKITRTFPDVKISEYATVFNL